jgi:hypothetical protein
VKIHIQLGGRWQQATVLGKESLKCLSFSHRALEVNYSRNMGAKEKADRLQRQQAMYHPPFPMDQSRRQFIPM